ncbi:hypothetical protein VHEMI06104 [[Torrubiella] hemipterigena]|uniref:N-acetyltransferase domain-containing protein n=1 Tax=[Torrubiella] hemipterigena TaxID=1531966 RepID=A0A0A1TIN0_9HYPO|nr:hypothetical protein VHEMI06104 [[Torrubiella] hemipterigena]
MSPSNNAYDGLSEAVAASFHSTRLQYIRPDENDAKFQAVHREIENDLNSRSLASNKLLRPTAPSAIEEGFKSFTDALLGVAICLQPSEEAADWNPEHGPTIIGTMGLGWGGVSPDTAHNRNASMGISLIKKYQNKGYGREAINWMIDWGFSYGGLHTISLTAAEFNPAGLHLYKSIGFVQEGRRREVCYLNRKFYDEIDFGMTEGEWETLRGINK